MELTYDNVFKWCVQLLIVVGDKMGMTYEEINVWVFCIIEPITFTLMLAWIIYLLIRVYKLKSAIRKLA